MRRIGSHIALVVFGVCIGLVLLEVALQVGAAVVRARTTRSDAPWSQGVRRVVAIGDSNTYGLYLEHPERDAYPKVFERLWNASSGLPPVEVMNLAFPGTNSSAARNVLRQVIAQVHPDLVMVMVGGNDWWTETRELQGLDRRAQFAIRLWNYSRVYRLLYMLRRALSPPGVVIAERWGEDVTGGGAVMRIGDASIDVGFTKRDFEKDPGQLLETLAPNLRGMLADARAAGVDVVLITYPADFNIYGLANPIMRDIGKEEQVPIIDVGAALRKECPRRPCALLHPDDHPTLAGHARTAQLLFASLRARAPQWLVHPNDRPDTAVQDSP
jgi:lysophospholipase L1-like esterase